MDPEAGTPATETAPAGTPNTEGAATDASVKTETAAPAAPAGTTTDDNATEGKAADAAPGNEDWAGIRARVSGTDEKLLKRLSRYSTLDEYIKAGYEAQNKLSSSKAVTQPTADSTPEEVAEYRAANGIPEKPEDYKIELPGGLVLGDNDKPLAEKFMAVAHVNNLSPAVVNAIIAQHLEAQEELVAAQQGADAKIHEEAMERLRSPEIWGSEFTKNRNMVINLLASAPEGVAEQIEGARLADGTSLANNVDILVWLNSLQRKINPSATLTDGNRSLSTAQIDNELAELQTMMGDYNSKYWKGPTSEKLQARFRELTAAQQK